MVPTGLGAFLSNVLFSLELTPPSTIIWPLQTIYRERGVNFNKMTRTEGDVVDGGGKVKANIWSPKVLLPEGRRCGQKEMVPKSSPP